MDYETGKWLERLDANQNAILAALKEHGVLEEDKDGVLHVAKKKRDER